VRTLISHVLATHLYSTLAAQITRLSISSDAVSTTLTFIVALLTLNSLSSYCVGCPDAVFNTVRRAEIGEVVIINCDTNHVENPFNDVSEMPQDIVSYLKKNLSHSSTELRGKKTRDKFA
jgi:hypothetical protein